VSLKMGRSHIGGGEWIKGNTKFVYYFEILAVIFELEKKSQYAIKPRRVNFIGRPTRAAAAAERK